ncbi:hypothetical protein [Psychroserpens sp.]|uniref:hypothetical protein n=1 Tax=Psychroserpens sp. TaxID=2020870 RepID=UPI001B16C9D2|nr:hypothetical protein [Psychroserpens sp.]MBO6607473.1 thioredoxin family protein [Psychroserpens sp.]MBO6632638.1 thioredoxin family protein [Psychroserpens sp.]MBO6654449.1 thioredoxin family protein [Psychroserpens sp.]MBO6681202.1 thioredoxin family protein [Psychroserpens sp.]MBO6749841.1 thioredoxin family protein [Psychroserpens sp.]
MKKLVYFVLFVFTLNVAAQEQYTWNTDYKSALQLSKSQDKPILAFVVNQQQSEATELLKAEFFASASFKAMASKLVLLKLDVSDQQSYNARMGIHYTNQRTAPGLALVGADNDAIGNPLVSFTSESISDFLGFINSKL